MSYLSNELSSVTVVELNKIMTVSETVSISVLTVFYVFIYVVMVHFYRWDASQDKVLQNFMVKDHVGRYGCHLFFSRMNGGGFGLEKRVPVN